MKVAAPSAESNARGSRRMTWAMTSPTKDDGGLPCSPVMRADRGAVPHKVCDCPAELIVEKD